MSPWPRLRALVGDLHAVGVPRGLQLVGLVVGDAVLVRPVSVHVRPVSVHHPDVVVAAVLARVRDLALLRVRRVDVLPVVVRQAPRSRPVGVDRVDVEVPVVAALGVRDPASVRREHGAELKGGVARDTVDAVAVREHRIDVEEVRAIAREDYLAVVPGNVAEAGSERTVRSAAASARSAGTAGRRRRDPGKLIRGARPY
jgi:hypothetical protein